MLINVTYAVKILSHMNLSSEIHIQSLHNINYTLTNMLINKVVMNVPKLTNICFQGNNKIFKKHIYFCIYEVFKDETILFIVLNIGNTSNSQTKVSIFSWNFQQIQRAQLCWLEKVSVIKKKIRIVTTIGYVFWL